MLPYILFLCAVMLPIALWIWFIRKQDASEPEPRRLIRRCFYVGLASALGAGFFEFYIFKIFGLPINLIAKGPDAAPLFIIAISVFLVGVIEELAKYIVLRLAVYFSTDFNQIFDGIVYGITVALGFSFFENILYFIDFANTKTTGLFIASTVMRGIFTTLGHVTFTGILGYYVGKAKFSNGNRTIILTKGIIFAALLHGVFDFLVAGRLSFGSLLALVLIFCTFFIFKRIWNKPEVRMVWQYIPPTINNQ